MSRVWLGIVLGKPQVKQGWTDQASCIGSVVSLAATPAVTMSSTILEKWNKQRAVWYCIQPNFFKIVLAKACNWSFSLKDHFLAHHVRRILLLYREIPVQQDIHKLKSTGIDPKPPNRPSSLLLAGRWAVPWPYDSANVAAEGTELDHSGVLMQYQASRLGCSFQTAPSG